MDFFKLVQSLDELIYEVLSWLLFFPTTLARVGRHPVRLMEATATELQEEPKRQFDDVLGPPLFLFLMLVLLHVVHVAMIGEDSLVTSNDGIGRYISDDTNLLIARVIFFGLLPLTLARRLLKARGQRLTKPQLRAPFYAQCYVAALFAMWIEAGVIVADQTFRWAMPAGIGIGLLGSAWLLSVEASWFRRQLDSGAVAAAGHATLGFVQWVAVVAVLQLIASGGR